MCAHMAKVPRYKRRYFGQRPILEIKPVDTVEYFQGFFWQERYVFMFYVSRNQACGHPLILHTKAREGKLLIWQKN